MTYTTLHHPATRNGTGLVLTHGAGGNRNSPLLIAVAEAFSSGGTTVMRLDLPYRRQRPTGPPRRGDAEKAREGLRQAITEMRQLVSGRVFLGGSSYGGRQASILLAETPGLADALLLLSYPLHPPGKPDQLRTAHLPNLTVPVVIAQGARDPFGTPDEIREAVKLIPPPVHLHIVESAGHDLKKGNWDVSVLPPLLR